MAIPVIAVVIIKIVAAALAVFLAAYLLNAGVKLLCNVASTIAETVGGVQNVILIGGIAYLAVNGGFVKL